MASRSPARAVGDPACGYDRGGGTAAPTVWWRALPLPATGAGAPPTGAGVRDRAAPFTRK